MNARDRRARQIMETPGHATQIIGVNDFRVRSQSDPSKFYTVSRTCSGLVCECPDHRKRGRLQAHQGHTGACPKKRVRARGIQDHGEVKAEPVQVLRLWKRRQEGIEEEQKLYNADVQM